MFVPIPDNEGVYHLTADEMLLIVQERHDIDAKLLEDAALMLEREADLESQGTPGFAAGVRIGVAALYRVAALIRQKTDPPKESNNEQA